MMMDESGFQHVRMIVSFPDFASASRGLDRIFGEPDVSASLLEAGLIAREPSFGLELFGLSSKVDELVYGLLPQATLHHLEPARKQPSQEADLEPEVAPAAA